MRDLKNWHSFFINFVNANLVLQDVNKERLSVVFECCTFTDLGNEYGAVLHVEISGF